MALLSIEERARYFRELGLGDYNEANIRALQKKYFKSKDVDGKYGTNTDNLLRHIYNVYKYTTNFAPEEFKCECGGKYCTGYPTYMKSIQLINLQDIRTHYGKPMKITSGMRCKKYNSVIGGSIANSKHLTGQATDFYMAGVTDTLANRKASIKWMKKLPNTTYIYGNGINSNGASVKAPYMGNALHYDTGGSTPTPKPEVKKLTVDGIGGPSTVRAAQTYFKCSVVDGYISGQNKKLQKYYPALTAVLYGKGGSDCVKAIQKWAGVSADGIWGEGTSKAVQKKLGVKADGIFGETSMKAFQTFLNNQLFPENVIKTPVTTTTKTTSTTVEKKTKWKGIDVSDWQDKIDWVKVKNDGIDCAIIRYADGDTLDKRFKENMKGAIAAGLHVGCYIFSRAKTKAQAEKEAERLFNAAKPYATDMPLYIDLEVGSLSKYADTVAAAFLNKMKVLGGWGGVYANLNWWEHYLTKTATNYSASPFWIAQYNDKITHKNPKLFGIWQYSSKGSVSGIKGKVDMDEVYVAYWEKSPEGNFEKPISETPVVVTPVITTPAPVAKIFDRPTAEEIKKASNIGMKKQGIAWAKKVAADNRIGYMNWSPSDKVTHTCPFCTKRITFNSKTQKFDIHTDEKHAGANCIGMGAAFQHNGCGFPTTCNCSVVSQKVINGKKDRLDIFEAKTDAEALKLAQKKFGTKELEVIREKRKGKTIPKSKWQPGDFCCRIDNDGKFVHVFTSIGNGKIFDDGGWSTRSKQCAIRDEKNFSARVIIRITAGRAYLSEGDEGIAVKKIQRYLGVGDDGIFGPKTKDAVIAFQKKNGLMADGLVGSATLDKMAEGK